MVESYRQEWIAFGDAGASLGLLGPFMLESLGLHLSLGNATWLCARLWEQTELETIVLADSELSEGSEQIGRLKTIRIRSSFSRWWSPIPIALKYNGIYSRYSKRTIPEPTRFVPNLKLLVDAPIQAENVYVAVSSLCQGRMKHDAQ